MQLSIHVSTVRKHLENIYRAKPSALCLRSTQAGCTESNRSDRFGIRKVRMFTVTSTRLIK
ncbi:MAG: hypothetical protein ACRC11_01465 [Xenococcaceae cyanobacterium]